jgi:hypothetical protein
MGDNSEGQLGDGTLVDRLRPVKVAGLTNVVRVDPVPVPAATGTVQVGAGLNHTVVVVERPPVIGAVT